MVCRDAVGVETKVVCRDAIGVETKAVCLVKELLKHKLFGTGSGKGDTLYKLLTALLTVPISIKQLLTG